MRLLRDWRGNPEHPTKQKVESTKAENRGKKSPKKKNGFSEARLLHNHSLQIGLSNGLMATYKSWSFTSWSKISENCTLASTIYQGRVLTKGHSMKFPATCLTCTCCTCVPIIIPFSPAKQMRNIKAVSIPV